MATRTLPAVNAGHDLAPPAGTGGSKGIVACLFIYYLFHLFSRRHQSSSGDSRSRIYVGLLSGPSQVHRPTASRHRVVHGGNYTKPTVISEQPYHHIHCLASPLRSESFPTLLVSP